jgi:hypothetical protein
MRLCMLCVSLALMCSFFQPCNPVSSQSMVPRRYLPTHCLIRRGTISRGALWSIFILILRDLTRYLTRLFIR